MKLKNRIINYYVVPPSKEGKMPRVFYSPVTISAATAKKLLADKLRLEKQELPKGNLLHVCFDVDSRQVYLPNAFEFDPERMEILLRAAQVRMTKDFGGFSSRPEIEGSPFNLLRVRSLDSFRYAQEMIQKHYGNKFFKNLPVIEANMDRMPSVAKILPKEFQNPSYTGGYIGPSLISSVSFLNEIDYQGNKVKEPKVLLEQKPPFILINIGAPDNKDATSKEGVVIAGYRDYLYDQDAVQDEQYIQSDISNFADLYAIKRYLYLGWPLEEISVLLLPNVHNFGELLNAIRLIMSSVESLVEEGYPNPSSVPYYVTFKIDPSDFPLDEAGIQGLRGRVDPYFRIIDYVAPYILIETPVFIPPEVCERVLRAKSHPFITKYNPIMKKIDVKGDPSEFKGLQREKNQLNKIKSLVDYDLRDQEKPDSLEFRVGPGARGVSTANPTIFSARKLSEYYYAADNIKKLCEQANIPFEDVTVILGPTEQLFGSGNMGGYMDEKLFQRNKLAIPWQIPNGDVEIYPPVIFVNSVGSPSYAEQTRTLIHEYRHHLFSLVHPEHEVGYGQMNDKRGMERYKEYFKYFSDPSEVVAHKAEIKYDLLLGRSTDEIVRDKVGGHITEDNHVIALKFRELVDEAAAELEKERTNEEPIGTSR